MTFDLKEYKQSYLDSARLLVDKMKKILVSEPGIEDVKTFHRFAHSLKSQALVMGFQYIGLTGRALEVIFKELLDNNGIIKIDAENIDIYKKALTSVENALDEIEKNEEEADLTETINKLEKIAGKPILNLLKK